MSKTLNIVWSTASARAAQTTTIPFSSVCPMCHCCHTTSACPAPWVAPPPVVYSLPLPAPRLSDDDIERIARRVVELLK